MEIAQSTQSPKRRRRWPWVILVVALGMGSGLGWWYWPRGDARFVGQWLLIEKGSQAPEGTIEFYRHGMGRFTAADPTEMVSLSFQWRAAGETLELGPRTDGKVHPYMETVAEFLMDRLGHSFLPGNSKYRFKIVDENTMELDDRPEDDPAATDDAGVPIVLRRVGSP